MSHDDFAALLVGKTIDRIDHFPYQGIMRIAKIYLTDGSVLHLSGSSDYAAVSCLEVDGGWIEPNEVQG